MCVRLALFALIAFAFANVALSINPTYETNSTTTTTGSSTLPPPTTPETTSTCTTTPGKNTTSTTNVPETTTTTTTTTTTPSPDGVPKFVLVENGTACLILKANLQLYIAYFSVDSALTKLLTVNDGVKVIGSCRSAEEKITLQWVAGKSEVPFNLTMKVVQMPKSPSNSGGSVVRDVYFEYFLSSDLFPLANETGYKNYSVEGSFFEAPAAMGFTCTAQQNISMGPVTLGVSHLHLEAFRNSTSTDFNEKAFDCVDIPSSNKVVPIVVGVTAAILIFLAIFAFFYGNRRRAQGYQTL